MLDIRFIRENPDKVKDACKRRNKDMDADVDEILAIDAERRKINTQVDEIKAEQNRASKQIPILKQNGEDVSDLMAEMKKLADESRELGNSLSELENLQREIILRIPNIPHESVPYGRDDRDNPEIRRWGEPRTFDFEPKAHWDIGSALNILDPERAAKVRRPVPLLPRLRREAGARDHELLSGFPLRERLYRGVSALYGQQGLDDRYRPAPEVCRGDV
jgi:seryl-tRNA synthetase